MQIVNVLNFAQHAEAGAPHFVNVESHIGTPDTEVLCTETMPDR